MPRDKVPCGNPLFLEWVEELRDAAREKGTKAAESYGKAARSLQLCPVNYPRPRDLVVLQGIGPKIVNILEGKWKSHCEENGLPVPGTPARASKGKGRAPPSPHSNPEDLATEESIQPPAKKRKPSKPKAYIPAKGSGGYGILLGLVLAIDQPEANTQVFLTKGELIRAAQPYSDSSYDHSEKGTFFTAWSGMKTLVGRGYVYVTGNPHKYCLTEDGYEVACAIRALIPDFAHLIKHPFLHDSLEALGGPGPSRIPSLRIPSLSLPPSPPATISDTSLPPVQPSKSKKFEFWYINSAGHRVPTLADAMSRLDPEEFVSIRKVEFRSSQLDHPFVRQLRLVDLQSQGEDQPRSTNVFAFILEEGAPPICSKFGEDVAALGLRLPVEPTKSVTMSTTDSGIFDDDDDWVAPVLKPSTSQIDLAKGDHLARTNSTTTAPVDESNAPASASPLRRHTSEASIYLSHSDSLNKPQHRRGPRLSSQVPPPMPFTDDSERVTQVIPDFQPSRVIVFPAGSYEVILVIDTREVESKTNRDRIAEKLAEKGVKVETRALRLGDMCWIARKLDGLGGEEDECVLDYVAERKRLDDLCSSIRDGRYNEQCFRLSNSCINNVFYIVEDWHTAHHMEFNGLQIMTAKSQIQVINGFLLRETHKLSETIDFLVTMTQVITTSLIGSDLHVIPTRYLSRSSYGTLQAHLRKTRPDTTYLTSFQSYQDLNDKNASKTLKERFARMLLCVKGMSAERVSAVLDEFDTPRSLWEALKERRNEEEEYKQKLGAEHGLGGDVDETDGKARKKKDKHRGPDMFFADRIKGDGRRKIGDALSKALWRAFMGAGEDD